MENPERIRAQGWLELEQKSEMQAWLGPRSWSRCDSHSVRREKRRKKTRAGNEVGRRMEQGSERKKVVLGAFGEAGDRTGWCWQPDWTPRQHWLHGLGGVPRQPEHWTCPQTINGLSLSFVVTVKGDRAPRGYANLDGIC